MSKKSKSPGTCVFCGRQEVTKQHMWPNWLNAVVPRTGNDHSRHITHIDMTVAPFAVLTPKTSSHQGPLGARKIRKVCLQCNTGWMSQIEEAAKPVIVPMIHGDKCQIELGDRSKLAAWSALMTIVAEFTDPLHMAISENERREFKRDRRPGSNWNIWAGSYSGDALKEYFYRHHGLLTSRVDEQPAYKTCNTQSSSFVVGSLFLLATSSSVRGVRATFDREHRTKLLPLWPITEGPQAWPPAETLSIQQVDQIADSFFNQLLNGIAHKDDF